MSHATPYGSAASDRLAPASTSVGRRERDILQVLIVDDVEMNREVAGYFLRSAGHEAVCVDDGPTAVAAAAKQDFDIVLMDVRMPKMDGLEATLRIRALGGARGQVPILALTGQSFAHQVEACRTAGMNGHVSKPFNPETLLDAVVRATTARSKSGNFGYEYASSAPPGTSLPIIASTSFDRVISSLTPTAAALYLQTVIGLGEALLRMLHAQAPVAPTSRALATAAHTLAASAGMFGCERLTAIGRRFQRAIELDAPDAPSLAKALSATIGTTLHELQTRTAGIIAGNPGRDCMSGPML